MDFHSRRHELVRALVLAAALAAPLPATPASAAIADAVQNSVVKVFSTVRYPDPYKPWSKQAPMELSGSGVVIEGRRILSNAHLVLYASQVQVQANESGDRMSATVEAVAPGIDLAVLKLDDSSFFDSHPPLPQAKQPPRMSDVVMAYGYPKGGTSLSITRGIISRIEFAPYNYPAFGLRIQIDAAINPGNSGGPAVVDGKMIGLAFSHLVSSENIGYVIPCEEIDQFLVDIADGHYDGKPAMFDECQTLENPALRSFLKLDKSVEGIVVHKPYSADPDYPLKEWDIITRIGDTPVDNQGMIEIAPDLRVFFKYLVPKVARDGKVPLTILRGGRQLQVSVPVMADVPTVIPDLEGTYPSYFVYGPIVFSTASTQFIGGFARGMMGGAAMSMLSASGSPLLKRLGDKPAFDGERLVVVSSPFFPHRLARGYGNPISQVVKTINGIRIRNLEHLVQVLRDSTNEFITIEFDSRRGETLVFPRREMVAATEGILADNDIRSQGSPDTLAIWDARSGRKTP